MYKYLITLPLIMFSATSMAAYPPPHCKEGAVIEGSVMVEGNNCDAGNCENYDYPDFNYDALGVVSKKHVLMDSTYRIKGDGAYYFSKGDNVKFYDSFKGYLGQDESNFEGNAYIWNNSNDSSYYDYPRTGWVWAIKKAGYPHMGCLGNGNLCRTEPYQGWASRNYNGGWCSKQKMYLQTAPKIIFHSAPVSDGPNEVTITVEHHISHMSLAGVNNNVQPRIWLRASGANGAISSSSKSLNNLTGTTTISTTTSAIGTHAVHVRISDGIYETEEYFGMVNVEGVPVERPCPTCDFY